MYEDKSSLNIGLIILASDFRVIGMNPYAQQVLGSTVSDLGKKVFEYHSKRTHPKIEHLLRQCSGSDSDMAIAMIMDVLNKFLMVNLSRVNTYAGFSGSLFAMTFIDVTKQTGAWKNPDSNLIEIKKFPVFFGNSLLILDTSSIYFIASDGNYCVVHTAKRSYHLLFTLKSMLQRYAGSNFFMTHKSYVVNLDHVQGIKRDKNGHSIIVFDIDNLPSIPVARRRIRDLKAALAPC